MIRLHRIFMLESLFLDGVEVDGRVGMTCGNNRTCSWTIPRLGSRDACQKGEGKGDSSGT